MKYGLWPEIIIGLFSLSHEQNKARFNSAMARKGAMKWNSHSVFATPKHLAVRQLKKNPSKFRLNSDDPSKFR